MLLLLWFLPPERSNILTVSMDLYRALWRKLDNFGSQKTRAQGAPKIFCLQKDFELAVLKTPSNFKICRFLHIQIDGGGGLRIHRSAECMVPPCLHVGALWEGSR